MTQSSIEWLQKEIIYAIDAKLAYENTAITADEIKYLCEKAKEMHKQEILEAFKASDDNPIDTTLYQDLSNADSEQYYKEKYGTVENSTETPSEIPFPPLYMVSRLEVIDDNGRAYVSRDKKNAVSASMQDNGRTLKIFITKK